MLRFSLATKPRHQYPERPWHCETVHMADRSEKIDMAGLGGRTMNNPNQVQASHASLLLGCYQWVMVDDDEAW